LKSLQVVPDRLCIRLQDQGHCYKLLLCAASNRLSRTSRSTAGCLYIRRCARSLL